MPRAPASRKPLLSPTKIATFLECAVKYRYIYQDKIGRYYMRAHPGLSFGSTLHRVLQQFHAAGATSTAAELAEQVRSSWISAGYGSAADEEAHLEEAGRIVSAYREAHAARTDRPLETLALEATITCEMREFRLTGRVDRIDRLPDGTLDVVDYKSGRLETSVEEVAGSLAMNCYQLILSRLYPESPVRGTIYCLRTGYSASYSLAGEALEHFTADIEEVGSQILSKDWSAVRPVRLEICPECDFFSRCSAYWRSAEFESPGADSF